MTQATVSKRTRSYGIVCPLCHRRLEVGKVDLGDSAGQEELQRALFETAWEARIVESMTPQCHFGSLLRQSQMVLLN